MRLSSLLAVLSFSLPLTACFVETRHPVGESRGCPPGHHWDGGSCRDDARAREPDRDHDKGRDHDKDHDKDHGHDHDDH